MTKTRGWLGARCARGFRFGLAAAGVGVALLACGDEGAGERSEPVVAGDTEIRVTCDADSMMTDLGWPQLPGSPVVGAVYMAALSYVGDEPCVAARFDSVLLEAVPQTTPIPGPLPVAISRGLDMDIGPGIPLERREMLRGDMIEPAELLLENASVTWIEPPVGGWLSAYDPPNVLEQNQRLVSEIAINRDVFILIVTRAYSAERITNLDGGTDGLPAPAYAGSGGMKAEYECAALPLGDVGAFQLFDGVFFGTVADAGPYLRGDLPRRFCPELPGVPLTPGNGSLDPPQ